MIQLSIVIIILCIVMMMRGWDRKQSIFFNLKSMKYFSFKIVTDILTCFGLILVDYSLLEKINGNTQNLLYVFSIVGWVILFICQLLWIQFTVSKLNRSISMAVSYDEKEKQLLSYVAVYPFSILMFGLNIYTKFF